MSAREVVIVGGGASGTITAIRLLHAMPGGRVTLVDRACVAGLGVAYSTQDEVHRLNVRAKDMTIWPETPTHFVDWLAEHGHDPADVAFRFMPRKVFGAYLLDSLANAAKESKAEFQVVHGEAVAVDDKLTVTLRDGAKVSADAVVLALGNRAPSIPRALAPLAGNPRFLANPWAPGAMNAIRPDDTVLIVGTGLTMVDAVLTLHRLRHRGKIYGRSRHGFLPQAHVRVTPLQCRLDGGAGVVKAAIKELRESGNAWREVLDGYRPKTNAFWQGLSWPERDKFRRRLQAFWDVHRHRIPEDVGELLDGLKAAGQLDVAKGGAHLAEVCGDQIVVGFRNNKGEEKIAADWVINCTGPAGDLQATKLPIVESVVNAGLAEYDPLGVGLMVDEAGRAGAGVWALGPLCKGCRFETTAIPEIRLQAKRIAEELVTPCSPSA